MSFTRDIEEIKQTDSLYKESCKKSFVFSMDRLLGILQILVWVLWTLLEYKSINTPFTHLVFAGEIIQRLSGIFHIRSPNFKFCTKDHLIWNDICAWFGNFRGAFYSLIDCSNQLTQNVGKNHVQRLKEQMQMHYILIVNAGFTASKQLFYNSRKRYLFVCGDHFSRRLISSSTQV